MNLSFLKHAVSPSHIYGCRPFDLNYKSPNDLIYGKKTMVNVKIETPITDDFILVECISMSGKLNILNPFST